MKQTIYKLFLLIFTITTISYIPTPVLADTLSLVGSDSFTGTASVAIPITDLQISGSSSGSIPVKLLVTSGTLQMSTTTGLTFTGGQTGSTLYFSGSLTNINNALATLTYTRGSTGTDTLEVSLVEPGEVFFTTNNHLYKFITGTINWNNAKTAAEGLTAYGASGYLATITSQAENDFVSGRLTGDGWIGGSDSAVEGTWKWVTGPETNTTFWSGTAGGNTVGGNYAHWNGGEPNQSGDEDCAETYVSSGSWNDLPCAATVSGYVVEFGTPGTLPTVTAKNISITTSSNPTVNTLSPTDNATGITLTSNLILTFSQTVTTGTGNILIKKTTDDSTVETINVTGGLVTGSGTNTITIDPNTTLDESTGYYVTIPGTAFRNGSNYYAGITLGTTWNFTTGDFTAPNVSTIIATPASTSANITWTTNELASTKVNYGLTSSYGTSTSESDTSPRILSHTKALSSLLACTTYHYQVVSIDGSTNTTSSTDNTFTTSGCTASATPSSTNSGSIPVSSGGSTTLTDSNTTLTVDTPSNITSAASTVVIQIKALDGSSVLDSINKPSNNIQTVGDIVFDVKAIINSTTILDSFDTPVTITYQYTDADISGLEESTLRLYHYHGEAWERLTNCSVNTSANTITCTTPSFSIFSLFGEYAGGGGLPPEAFWPIKAPSSGFSITINNNALSATNPVVTLSFTPGPDTVNMALSNTVDFIGSSIEKLAPSKTWALTPGLGEKTVYVKFYNKWGQSSAPVSSSITINNGRASASSTVKSANISLFTRNLQAGTIHSDVLRLQKFLNTQGIRIAENGPGSPGKETTYYGPATVRAVKRYQESHPLEILSPSGLTQGTGYFGPSTRNFVNKNLGQ